MKLVSWNLGCAGKKYRHSHDDAWRYLLDELRPDIAVVQEALLSAPNWVRERGHVMLRRSYGTQDWGSGVFVRARSVIESSASLHGSYIAALDTTMHDGTALSVSSVHVCPDKKQKLYLRELSDYLKPVTTDRALFFAGDFNAARLYDKVNKRNEYGWFFDELSAHGFHDCHWAIHGREVASCWANSRGTSYQTDHMFVSKTIAHLVRTCDVVDNADVRRLSDHGPLRMVLDDPAAP